MHPSNLLPVPIVPLTSKPFSITPSKSSDGTRSGSALAAALSCEAQLCLMSDRWEGRFLHAESRSVSRSGCERTHNGIGPANTLLQEFLQKRDRHPLSR